MACSVCRYHDENNYLTILSRIKRMLCARGRRNGDAMKSSVGTTHFTEVLINS